MYSHGSVVALWRYCLTGLGRWEYHRSISASHEKWWSRETPINDVLNEEETFKLNSYCCEATAAISKRLAILVLAKQPMTLWYPTEVIASTKSDPLIDLGYVLFGLLLRELKTAEESSRVLNFWLWSLKYLQVTWKVIFFQNVESAYRVTVVVFSPKCYHYRIAVFENGQGNIYILITYYYRQLNMTENSLFLF